MGMGSTWRGSDHTDSERGGEDSLTFSRPVGGVVEIAHEDEMWGLLGPVVVDEVGKVVVGGGFRGSEVGINNKVGSKGSSQEGKAGGIEFHGLNHAPTLMLRGQYPGVGQKNLTLTPSLCRWQCGVGGGGEERAVVVGEEGREGLLEVLCGQDEGFLECYDIHLVVPHELKGHIGCFGVDGVVVGGGG